MMPLLQGKPAESKYSASLVLLFLSLLCFCAYQSAQHQHHFGGATYAQSGETPSAAASEGKIHPTVQSHQAHASHAEGMMGMMPMFFVNSCHATLWLQNWVTDGPVSYGLTLCFLAVFAFAHEALAWQRSLYLSGLGRESRPRRLNPKEKLIMAALYGLNMVSSYLLMLAVMTYNVGFCIAVVLGLGAGHFALTDIVAGLAPGSGGVGDLQQGMVRSDACCDTNRGFELARSPSVGNYLGLEL